ncbi:hypothetical protein H6G00_01865 [Leptolyngbya sp. FACHB-541]|uniref:hypothetical protein n=1 Tax=Leptolyngbya sp. FACHB-541 TaxID=2692810 RepID=UPI0016836C74|nr:hypothetical protein [Leptolyngbya sp. FACHB-541]MBD1995378.1 hypothetical protein [Leptolyngbya sp. FACHB-541]
MFPFTPEKLQEWRGQLIDALQVDKFHSWLLDQPPTRIVGVSRTSCGCPIQTYLAEVLPWLDAEVGAHQIYTFFPRKVHPLQAQLEMYYMLSDHEAYGIPPVPEWVTLFVNELDTQFKNLMGGSRHVTAFEALEALEAIAPYPTVEEVMAQRKIKQACIAIPSILGAMNVIGGLRAATYQQRPKYPNIQIVRQGRGYNVVYDDVEPEPWNPTGEPRLDQTINEFCGELRLSDRGTTIYEGRCDRGSNVFMRSLDDSFGEIGGWGDAYRCVWLSEALNAAATYCEDDISVEVAADPQGYERIVQSAMQCYTIEPDSWVQIPKSLPLTQSIVDAMPQEWRQVKLRANFREIIARGLDPDEFWAIIQKWFEENPHGTLQLIPGDGGRLNFAKSAFEQPTFRAEFDRIFKAEEEE